MGQAIITRELWANRSNLRFGIYKEEILQGKDSKITKATVRYYVFGVMGTIFFLLVCFVLYDIISGHVTTTSRSKDTMKHLLLLNNSTKPSFLSSALAESRTTEMKNNVLSSNLTTLAAKSENHTNCSMCDTSYAFLTFNNTKNPRENYEITRENNTLVSQSEGRTFKLGKIRFPSFKITSSRSNKVKFIDAINKTINETKIDEPYKYEFSESVERRDKIAEFVPNNERKNTIEILGPAGHYLWRPKQIPLQNVTMEERIMNYVHNQQPRPFRSGVAQGKRPLNVYKNNPNAMSPYYGFSSSNSYPQLSNYRYPNDVRNIQDIIKFMTENTPGIISSLPNNQQLLSILHPHPGHRAVKFSGVYKGPNDEEDANSQEENVGEIVLANKHNPVSVPASLLNGHAYIADPFHEYKPSDPSEINLLASNDVRFPKVETQLHPHNVNFNQGWKPQRNAQPNQNFFPRPPINFGKPVASATNGVSIQQSISPQIFPGTYTTAIYKPFGKDSPTAPASNGASKKKKSKPFSVMLDIYPMTDGISPQESSLASQAQVSPYPIPTTQLRPPKTPRFPFHHSFGEFADQTQDQNDVDNRHQMIVHLNLYPRKKKPAHAHNRNDAVHSFQIEVKSDSFSNKNSDTAHFSSGYIGEDQMELPMKIWEWAQGNLMNQDPGPSTSGNSQTRYALNNHSGSKPPSKRISYRNNLNRKRINQNAKTVLKPIARSDDGDLISEDHKCEGEIMDDSFCEERVDNEDLEHSNINVTLEPNEYDITLTREKK